jgi:hypothetical protein
MQRGPAEKMKEIVIEVVQMAQENGRGKMRENKT